MAHRHPRQPLQPGFYMTREGARAEVLAIRTNYEGRDIAVGCTHSGRDGAILGAMEWDAETGRHWYHDDSRSPTDIVGPLRAA